MLLSLKAAGVIVNLVPNEEPLPKKSTIAERERSSLDDASVLIREITKWFTHQKLDAYAIEGFSFGSTGNRLAQISGYQWVLRWEFRNIIKETKDFWIFSPMTIKAVAGKGNFKKEQMIDAFIQSDDPILQKTGLWKALNSNPEMFQTKRGNWLKPIDDIIDAYWVLRTLELHRELQKEK